jgi:hypothetical protein
MNMLQKAKAKLATPFMRRLLHRPDIFSVRRDLSFQYITGSGVEVGALNAPLEVRPNVMVKYADLYETEPLRSDYAPDIISDLYPVHVTTRKSLGLMTRKLSVTESQRSAQFRGTFSRRKPSVASANWVQVA